jgi:photoactive yellow protein
MAVQKIDVAPEELPAEIGNMNDGELDALPFGAIQLDPIGVVVSYNRYESELSRRPKAQVIGKNFFADVAPCTRVKKFHGAFEEGVARKQLNEVFDFTFNFPSGAREVRIRMIYSAEPRPGIWIFVTPLG